MTVWVVTGLSGEQPHLKSELALQECRDQCVVQILPGEKIQGSERHFNIKWTPVPSPSCVQESKDEVGKSPKIQCTNDGA